jgi:hypothetical protein
LDSATVFVNRKHAGEPEGSARPLKKPSNGDIFTFNYIHRNDTEGSNLSG